MKTILYLVGGIFGFCLLPQTAQAQNQERALHLPIESVQTHSIGNELEISFTLQLDTLTIPSNQLVRLTPVLVKEEENLPLHPFILAGRRQYLLQERKGTQSTLIHRTNGQPQRLTYTERFPYQAWMNGAKLILTQDLCGCGGSLLNRHQTAVKTLHLETSTYEIQPALAFLAPKAETVKYRQESGRAFLDFPVNQTTIYPKYRNNEEELKKIRATIDRVRKDTLTQITHLHIHGYASPEGSYANNQRLAQGRAESLKQYVQIQYTLADSLFTVESTPEDWDGLHSWVSLNHFTGKEAVQHVLTSTLDEDSKNKALQDIDKGSVYHHLLKHVYPSLRHSDYTIQYTVRHLTVEEAKQLLKTRPQLLSLSEMFAIAATYEPGSDAFNHVFEIAVHLFPEDETANLNAALLALTAKNYRRAARYLEKAGTSPEAVHAHGVLCLLTGRYQEAENYLKQAEAAGIPQATTNLTQLKLKMANIELNNNL